VTFHLTERQLAAQAILASDAQHLMLFGGSRSGKTFLLVRNVVMRGLKAPDSRHAIFRYRFNAVKAAIISDTFPKVMKMAFPGVSYGLDKTDWFATLPGGAQIWFGGLDEKERTEKVLGQEFATLYLNECSQIPYESRNLALTRLAQAVDQKIEGRADTQLRPRVYYDENPPSKAHWTYKLFVAKSDPETGEPLHKPDNYAAFRINPADNAENIADGYLDTLDSMSARNRRRFKDGEFGEATPGALFSEDDIEKWRVTDGVVPEFVRVVVAVDPSGSGDEDNADNDEIGIAVVGLGQDGIAYLLEDCSVKAGPATWGRIAATAFDRHKANIIVGEANYGGAMVGHVIETARPRTPFKLVTATRGKAVRAEPFSALYENGKVRHAGRFRELETELTGFNTLGYVGEGSPNRADAAIWALAELFPGLVASRAEKKPSPVRQHVGVGSWMS
jgi:phage terminase large subunit-like protein